MRYGSRHPFVIRSSTRMPMYASSRPSSNRDPRIARTRCAALIAGNEALRRRFLVTGRAVDLPGQKAVRRPAWSRACRVSSVG